MTPRTSMLCATILLTALLAPPASGADPSKQESKQEDEATLIRARQQYDHGRELAIRGQFEEARKVMEDTWNIKKHWQTASYLGYTESMTKRYRSAAEHIAYGLRVCPRDADPSQRQSVEAIQNEVRTHVATVHVHGVEADASLLVDGSARDSLFLPDPVFLEPGTHTIEARRSDGKSRKRTITAEAGKTMDLDLTAEPVPNASSSAQPSLAPAPTRYPPTYETSSRGWSPRTWTIASEGALTAVALGIGVGFGLRVHALESDAKDTMANLKTTSATPCEGSGAPQCSDVKNLYADRDTAARWANIGFVTGGVLGIATVATLLLWPKPTATATGGSHYWISPTAGSATGLAMGGMF